MVSEWVAEYPDIFGIIGVGNTEAEAIMEAEIAKNLYFDYLEENELDLPINTNNDDGNKDNIIELLNQVDDGSSIIIVKKTPNADTRSLDPNKPIPSKEVVLKETKDHIRDVKRLLWRVMRIFKDKSLTHDWTKVEYFDEFYDAIFSGKTGEEFFNLDWYKLHETEERHHLNRIHPEDVNLFDVIEMIVDVVAASVARSGNIFSKEIDIDLLKKATDNTFNYFINITKAEGEQMLKQKEKMFIKDGKINYREMFDFVGEKTRHIGFYTLFITQRTDWYFWKNINIEDDCTFNKLVQYVVDIYDEIPGCDLDILFVVLDQELEFKSIDELIDIPVGEMASLYYRH